ncbi:hypothetical protein ACOSQ2_023468 [Xanthoceras sorbifolium]
MNPTALVNLLETRTLPKNTPFEAPKRRGDSAVPLDVSGMIEEEGVRAWSGGERKKKLLVKSRNRVTFAWTLVALCCGSHA